MLFGGIRRSIPSYAQGFGGLSSSHSSTAIGRGFLRRRIKITRDPEEYTRLYAVTLLGSIGDHRALENLQQIANTDPNRKIRRSAAKSVALIQKRG
jgi:hypothetical protein